MASINDLSLAKGLTAKVEEACAGLETGEAPILDHVSEITAELLKWWFQTEFQDARTFNFHPGQRQALLNVCLLYTSPSPRDGLLSRMPSSA